MNNVGFIQSKIDTLNAADPNSKTNRKELEDFISSIKSGAITKQTTIRSFSSPNFLDLI